MIAQKKIDSSVQWNSDQYYTTWKLVLGTKIFPWSCFKINEIYFRYFVANTKSFIAKFFGKILKIFLLSQSTGNRNLGKLVKFPYCYVIAKKIRYFKDFRKKTKEYFFQSLDFCNCFKFGQNLEPDQLKVYKTVLV